MKRKMALLLCISIAPTISTKESKSEGPYSGKLGSALLGFLSGVGTETTRKWVVWGFRHASSNHFNILYAQNYNCRRAENINSMFVGGVSAFVCDTAIKTVGTNCIQDIFPNINKKQFQQFYMCGRLTTSFLWLIGAFAIGACAPCPIMDGEAYHGRSNNDLRFALPYRVTNHNIFDISGAFISTKLIEYESGDENTPSTWKIFGVDISNTGSEYDDKN